MSELENKLKAIALKTMFSLTDEEMPEMIKEYEIFMNYVDALESIDTEGVAPLCFPYEQITTFLREDEPVDVVEVKDLLSNGPDVVENQIRVPKVVG